MKRNSKGQFVKGTHWRSKKPYWDREWLFTEYIVNNKSAAQIAKEQNCAHTNISYFLKKHNIPRRTMSEIRSTKHWGSSGILNGMHGRTGSQNPRWKGGISPERQRFYSSSLWAQLVLDVWERDDSKCQRCSFSGDNRRYLHIHHIIAFENREHRASIDNLILLCSKCHGWVHSKNNMEKEYINDNN